MEYIESDRNLGMIHKSGIRPSQQFPNYCTIIKSLCYAWTGRNTVTKYIFTLICQHFPHQYRTKYWEMYFVTVLVCSGNCCLHTIAFVVIRGLLVTRDGSLLTAIAMISLGNKYDSFYIEEILLYRIIVVVSWSIGFLCYRLSVRCRKLTVDFLPAAGSCGRLSTAVKFTEI